MADDVAVVDTTARFQALYEKLELEAVTNEQTVDADSIEEFKRRILVQIAEQTTWEGLNEAANTTGLSGKQLAGNTYVLQDAVVKESADQFRSNSMLKKFAVVRAVNADGEETVFTIGSDTAVMQLITARDTEGLGFPVLATLLAREVGAGELLYWKFLGKPQTAGKGKG